MKSAMGKAVAVVTASATAAVFTATGMASGAELVTAEVTTTVNDVTVPQGGSVTQSVNVSATGAIDCEIGSANASTATVDTSYQLTGGALSSSSPSAALKFYSDGTALGASGNCGVAWDGKPTPYQVSATFAADAATPVGDYSVRLSSAAGTTDQSNVAVDGAKLSDSTATTITVHVVAGNGGGGPTPPAENSKPQPKDLPTDPTGDEGSKLTAQGSFSDADGDKLTIEKVSGAGAVQDNGDGTWSWAHTPGDNGSGSVEVKASDGKDQATVTFTWTARNVAPSVGDLTVGGTGTACVAGNKVTLGFGFTDPGEEDTASQVSIDWGDGSAATTYTSTGKGAQPEQSHTFAAGTYTIGVTVTDKDGGRGTSAANQGSVSLLYKASGILAPFNSDGSSVWKYGSTIPVKVSITDCNGTPVPGLAPKVGTSSVSTSDPAAPIGEVASTSAADTTGVMRFDASAGQYIYNFATKNLSDSTATYYMTVKGTSSAGKVLTNSGVVQQKFGVRTK